jgi:hypothetical protein
MHVRHHPARPCADHSCDHCYICDVLGICCLTIPPTDRDAILCAVASCGPVSVTVQPPQPDKAARMAGLMAADLAVGVARPTISQLLLAAPNLQPVIVKALEVSHAS